MANREAARLARRLATAGARIVREAEGYRLLSPLTDRRGAVEAIAVKALLADGALDADGAGYVLSQAGRAMVRRRLAGGDDFGAQHQPRERRTIEEEGGRASVLVDQGESPLAWLRSRKGRDGRPLIDDAAFQAGERLRADFTRGQLMPRVTANWSAAVASGRRGGAGGMAELTDAALSARLRVERALAAAGPEFSGLLVDFCCFLKGIEEIEHERGWPKRSAKLVLQLALSALARHYGLASGAQGRASAPVRHWGAEDFKPKAG
ncbi:DUF6456 domain-containing protein [Kaistia defluvii]|uniref:DUF6456 domain-containing protein n=1 Tax=Kaistia defluvii TaxID=410841 RepID=UPI00225186AE|nr:DUF6456 domain-containing protein [Kaistia defluvii]MCX5520147.1 DUF6456 domain-containing protein [Kaistia defluvii]